MAFAAGDAMRRLPKSSLGTLMGGVCVWEVEGGSNSRHREAERDSKREGQEERGLDNFEIQ